jgi:hypothetical protein
MHKATKTTPAPFPRNLPMYLKGKQQSDEFARGAWAFLDALAKLYDYDTAKFSHEDITVALADEFSDHAGKGGDYSRGFATASLGAFAMAHCVGLPAIDVWRPLRMELRYRDGDGPEPTPGSKLYELDGEAVSVAPDGTRAAHRARGSLPCSCAVAGEAALRSRSLMPCGPRWRRLPRSTPASAAPEIGFEDTVMLPTPIDNRAIADSPPAPGSRACDRGRAGRARWLRW